MRTHELDELLRTLLNSGERISALCYVVDRGHEQYAGRLTIEDQLRHVRQGHGQSGANRDYVLSTVTELESQGFREGELHRLAELLRHDPT